MTEDQEMRMSILEICKGSTSEAKMAYYWVMDASNSSKAKPLQAGRVASGQIGSQQGDQFPCGGVSYPVNVSREQQEALQQHAQTEAMLLAQGRNERGPYIGGGSSD